MKRCLSIAECALNFLKASFSFIPLKLCTLKPCQPPSHTVTWNTESGRGDCLHLLAAICMVLFLWSWGTLFPYILQYKAREQSYVCRFVFSFSLCLYFLTQKTVSFPNATSGRKENWTYTSYTLYAGTLGFKKKNQKQTRLLRRVWGAEGEHRGWETWELFLVLLPVTSCGSDTAVPGEHLTWARNGRPLRTVCIAHLLRCMLPTSPSLSSGFDV